jgi:ABC-2 type transport system ATP-binding protein
LLGPNGAGKTTTIGMLCTLVRPTAGRARAAGFDVATHPAGARQRIDLVFQGSSLDGDWSVRPVGVRLVTPTGSAGAH